MYFLSKLARGIVPYVAGEQPKEGLFIKLNTNENPYPPSPEVTAALREIDSKKLTRYSDPNNLILRNAIAEKYGLGIENIFVGNGSDEVLGFCFPAFFDAEGNGIAFADITYSFYPVYCNLFGIKKNVIPLKGDYCQDIAGYLDTKAQGIIIANPNAPTGIVLARETVEGLVKALPDKLVIVDEAYSDFSGESVADLVDKYENLLVVKTFSKSYSLAGIRLGFALGNKTLIEGLERVKNSFNSYTVNYISERLGAAAIKSDSYYKAVNDNVVNTRELFVKNLSGEGFQVLPSGANFVFAKHPLLSGLDLYQALKEKGILVRHFNNDLLKDFLRISIGTEIEMVLVFATIKEIVKQKLQ